MASQMSKPIAPPTRADTRSIPTAKRDVRKDSARTDASETRIQADITMMAPDLNPKDAEIMYKQLDIENKELKREQTKQQDLMRLAENKLATATARHNHELAMAKNSTYRSLQSWKRRSRLYSWRWRDRTPILHFYNRSSRSPTRSLGAVSTSPVLRGHAVPGTTA